MSCPARAASPGTGRCWRIAHSECSLGWGGQEQRVLGELTGFQRRGSRVCLFAPVHSEISRRAAQAGVPVLPLDVSRIRFPLNVVCLARRLRRERIQILNLHSSRDGWLLGLAGRLARVPLIIRTRHIDVDYPLAWLSRHAFSTLADHVLTSSDRITAHLQARFRLPAGRISTLPTGVDLARFTPEGPKADLVSGASGVPLIGMVSVLRSWKGHGVFLRAARALYDAGFPARYVIVGDGPMRSQIEAEIAELRLVDRVTLTGHREDVQDVLRALSVLVIASTKHEGVPQVGLQALATKTPVVGSDAGGTSEVIRPGETGRISPVGDAAALARTIRETLEQRQVTSAYCENGRALVESAYSLEAMLDRLEEIYRRYLDRGTGA